MFLVLIGSKRERKQRGIKPLKTAGQLIPRPVGYGEDGVGVEWIVTFRVHNGIQGVVCNLGGILTWAC